MTESNRPESISNTESDYIGSFDTLFDEIGEFGRYQIITAILTCLAIGVSTCGLFNFVFSAALAENRCYTHIKYKSRKLCSEKRYILPFSVCVHRNTMSNLKFKVCRNMQDDLLKSVYSVYDFAKIIHFDYYNSSKSTVNIRSIL